MKHDQSLPPVFSIDVSADNGNTPLSESNSQNELVDLLRQLVVGQEKQNELLEDLIDQMSAGQRQRAQELYHWRKANPELSKKCRLAAEALGRVQTEFLESMADEIRENVQSFHDGDFVFNEFIDRFGPRLAHMNGVLQMLAQLSSTQPPQAQG